jgi:hypothetical protein
LATANWEFDTVPVSNLGRAKFGELLQRHEAAGWEFIGMNYFSTRPDGSPENVWMFRRPTAAAQEKEKRFRAAVIDQATTPTEEHAKKLFLYRDYVSPKVVEALRQNSSDDRTKAETARLQAEIASLEAQLAAAKARQAAPKTVTFKDNLPMDAKDLAETLSKLAAKRFKDSAVKIVVEQGRVIVQGDDAVVAWASKVVEGLTVKP